MPSVKIRQDEPFDVILRRFRRACEKAGLFTESRRREYYEKPTTRFVDSGRCVITGSLNTQHIHCVDL